MTLTQETATCWFNALMMGIFYSQGMRAVVMNAMPKWQAKPHERKLNILYDTFKDIVLSKFLYKAGNWSKKALHQLEPNAQAFKMISPEFILSLLHKVDRKDFFNQGLFQPQRGGYGQAYLQALFKLLHVTNYTMVDEMSVDTKSVYYKSRLYGLTFYKDPKTHSTMSSFDPKKYVHGSPKAKPDLLLIRKGVKVKGFKSFSPTKLQFLMGKATDTVYMYNGKKYIVDSMYLANFNWDMCQKSHAIAGITCGNKRYLYNGWAKYTIDSGIDGASQNQLACPLMEIDWARNINLCINHQMCGMNDAHDHETDEMCFNPQKGYRFLIAIREDLYNQGHDYNLALSAPTAALNKACPSKTEKYNPASDKQPKCEDISSSVYNKNSRLSTYNLIPRKN
jgi:hypothetical protein